MKTIACVALLLLTGCATTKAPPCAAFEAHSVVVEGQYFVIMDQGNAQKLGLLLKGLDAGTCSLPK